MTVLCSDKTGTLTEGVIHLQDAVDLSNHRRVELHDRRKDCVDGEDDDAGRRDGDHDRVAAEVVAGPFADRFQTVHDQVGHERADCQTDNIR